MSGGGSSRNQTATTTSEPPKYLQPFLQEGMQGAQGLYRGGPQEYYPGQTVVGFSPETEAALGMQTNRANAGSQVMNAGNAYAANTLGSAPTSQFGGATNPALDATFNRGADQIMSRLKTDFAGSGRNTGAAMPVASEQLGSFANDLYGGDYQNERNRMATDLGQQRGIQLGVLGQAPGLASAGYMDADRLAAVGAQREDLTGRQYQDSANRYDFGQAAPGNNLDQYLARLQGYPGGVTSNTTPIYRNTGAGAMGGAMAGYGLGSQFGYGGLGAGLGGLLGAFG